MVTPNKRPPCALCDAAEHACSICGAKGDDGAHRGCFSGGRFAQLWRCMAHLYDKSQDETPPTATPRYTARPTFIADAGRTARMTRVVILCEDRDKWWLIAETTDGPPGPNDQPLWNKGRQSLIEKSKWQLTKI